MSTLTLNWVKQATPGYVNAQPMSDGLSLALASGLGLLLFGPGGHGKSEFLEAAFAAIDGLDPYVKSLGQGTTTEELFGGIDLDAFNRPSGATVQYNVDKSFLPHPVVVFEELFDAPPRVLTFLKDTITARRLRNGAQQCPMNTRVLAAATNHSPQDVASFGSTVAALVERFPIQVHVTWESYTAAQFLDMYTAVDSAESPGHLVKWGDILALQDRTAAVTVTPVTQKVLAHVLAELHADQVTISPRTAMFALRLTQAAAAINGRDRTLADDVKAVMYLPGCQAHAGHIAAEIADLKATLAAAEAVDNVASELQALETSFVDGLNLGQLRDLHAQALDLKARAEGLRADSSLRDRIGEVRRGASQLAGTVGDMIATTQSDAQIAEAEASLRRLSEALNNKSAAAAQLKANRDDVDTIIAMLGAVVPNAFNGSRLADVQQSARSLKGRYSTKIRSLNNGWSKS